MISQTHYRSETGASALKIVLLVLLVIIALSVSCGVYVYLNAGKWLREGGSVMAESVFEELLDTFDYSEEESAQVMMPIRDFTAKVRNSEVSLEEAVVVAERLMQQAAPILLLAGFDRKYVQSSGLSEEEKEQGRIHISRCVRGVKEKLIPFDNITGAFSEIEVEQTDETGKKSKTLPNSLEDERVRMILAKLKTHADSAGVSDEKFSFDPAKEVSSAIDQSE